MSTTCFSSSPLRAHWRWPASARLFLGSRSRSRRSCPALAITESRAAAEARQRLLPFRDLFAVLFFVAIGALIDPTALLKGLGWLGLLLGLLIVARLIPVYALARFVRVSARPLQVGIGLAQIGEFSFVLATIGLAHNLIPGELYAAMLASVVITIAASTVLVRVGFTVDARRPPRPAG